MRLNNYSYANNGTYSEREKKFFCNPTTSTVKISPQSLRKNLTNKSTVTEKHPKSLPVSFGALSVYFNLNQHPFTENSNQYIDNNSKLAQELLNTKLKDGRNLFMPKAVEEIVELNEKEPDIAKGVIELVKQLGEDIDTQDLNKNNTTIEDLLRAQLNGIKKLPFADIIRLNKAFAKIPHYTKEEYQSLTAEELELLRDTHRKLVESLNINDEKIHDTTATMIKNSLDKRYGEDNYTVITIGRSLSSIGKCLGYKIGEDRVINMPLSGAAVYKSIDTAKKAAPHIYSFLQNNSNLLERLKENRNHNVVVMDYYRTGASLEGALDLIKTTFDKYGINANTISENVLNCIPDKELNRNLSIVFYINEFKHFTFVDKCMPEEIHEISNKVRDFDFTKNKNPKDRYWFKEKYFGLPLVRFTILDNEMRKKADFND